MAKKPNQKNLQRYLNRIEAAEKHRDNYKELWKACYKRYRNYVDPLPEGEKRSNISIPYIFNQVETVLPRLIETLFASRPYVALKGRDITDEPNAKSHETLLDWQMNERMDIQDIFHGGIKGELIYGTAIGYVGWKLDERKVIKKQLQPVYLTDENEQPMLDEMGQPVPLTDDDGSVVQEYRPMQMNEVEYDDPEVKFIDLGNFFADPSAEDIDGARYAGHVDYMTKEQLQRLEEQEVISIDWKKIPKDNKTNTARNDRMSAVGLPTDQGNENENDGLYEVHCYYEDDKHVVIINRAYLAKEGENPFWHKRKPYRKDVYIRVPGEFYGMGIVEVLGDLQDELNTERNMRIDYRAFALRRMFKVRRGANVDKKQLKWRQGGTVDVDDMDDIQEFKVEPSVGQSFNQENTIKQDMQDASGAQDVVMGQSGTAETATTTMTKDNNSSMRFKLTISSIEKRLLVGISRLMIQLNQQFVDDTKRLRVTGESGDEWMDIAPEEIQGEFDLIAAGSSVEPLANKEAFKQRMVELYGVVAADPLLVQFPDKRRNLLRKVYEAFDIKDVDSLLPTDQELQMMMQPPMMPGMPVDPALEGGANTAMQDMPLIPGVTA